MKSIARVFLFFVFFVVSSALVADGCGSSGPSKLPARTGGSAGTSRGAGGQSGGTGAGGTASGGAGQGGTTGSGAAGTRGSGGGGGGSVGGGGTGGSGGGAAGSSGGSVSGDAAGGGGDGQRDSGPRDTVTTADTGGTGSDAAGGAGGAARQQVQALLTMRCTGCHSGGNPPQGLNLQNVAAVVGQPSTECPTKMRIVAGSPTTSYLLDKVRGASQAAGGCFMGVQMPRNATALSQANIDLIVSWISAGAN